MSSPRTGPMRASGHSAPVQTVVDHVLSGVRDGRFAPGQRLAEPDLSEETSVGRVPVREALRILAGDGVVEIVPFKGARIRRPNRIELLQQYQVIAGLNAMAVVLAAEAAALARLAPGVEARLEGALAEAERIEGTERWPQRLRALEEIHIILLDAVSNPFLTQAVGRLHVDLLHRLIGNVMNGIEAKPHIARYQSLVENVVQGDAPNAKDAYRSHANAVAHSLSPAHPVLIADT